MSEQSRENKCIINANLPQHGFIFALHFTQNQRFALGICWTVFGVLSLDASLNIG
jgi:hypothetical protein